MPSCGAGCAAVGSAGRVGAKQPVNNIVHTAVAMLARNEFNTSSLPVSVFPRHYLITLISYYHTVSAISCFILKSLRKDGDIIDVYLSLIAVAVASSPLRSLTAFFHSRAADFNIVAAVFRVSQPTGPRQK